MPASLTLRVSALWRQLRCRSTLSAPDERTLDIRLGGSLFTGPLSPLFRDLRRPLQTGDRIELTDLTITLLEATREGDVLAVRFAFAVPLEDASLRWVRWEGDGYVPFTPPPVGGTMELPAARGFIDQYR